MCDMFLCSQYAVHTWNGEAAAVHQKIDQLCVCVCDLFLFSQYAVHTWGLYKIVFCVWAFVPESRKTILRVRNPLIRHPHPTPLSLTLLRNTMRPPDPPLLRYTPHNISDGNIV